ALTKYFGIVLVALLAVYTLGRGRRFAIYLAFLLIPLAVISNYELITEEKYGHGLFSAATMASSSISSATRPSHIAQLLMGLAFAAMNLVRQKSAEALLLMVWVFGTLAFATWFNWSITARTLLPMAPAVAFLTMAQFEQRQKRNWSKYVRLLAAAALSMLIAV